MPRGRPKKFDGPAVTTTVRVPIAEWKWVKEHRAEFSSILRRAIRTLMKEEETRADLAALQAWRDAHPNIKPEYANQVKPIDHGVETKPGS